MKEEIRKNAGCKDCQTITCIHCIGNKCTTDECQYFERYYRQEH